MHYDKVNQVTKYILKREKKLNTPILLISKLEIKKNHNFVQFTYPAGNDDPSDNRNKGEVCEPSLPLKRHKVSKNGSEEGRGGTNSLVKRHRQVPQRYVPKHNGDTENKA